MTDKALARAIEILKVASDFIREHASSAIVYYDGADCDGYCLADDCMSAVEGLEAPPAPAGYNELLEAARDVISCASDTYKKRNGRIASLEDDSGEKCWIVTGDAFEELRTALESAPPAPQPRVKPLVWDDPKPANNWLHIARSIFGEYYVSIDGGRHYAMLEANEKPHEFHLNQEPVGDVWAAKAIAEADYKHRILSALEGAPTPTPAGKLDLNITKEWFEKRAALEGDHEISAGKRKTMTLNLTPDEIAKLEALLPPPRIPAGWKLVPVEPTEEMKEAVTETENE